MSLQERSATQRVQNGRERWVARGISTPPLVVARAEGAPIWDADGREYVDFANGSRMHNASAAPATVLV